MKKYSKFRISQWNGSLEPENDLDLIEEEPLSIRIQGRPYSVILRTPGEEIAHVAGFCLAEGIIDSNEDLGAIAFCDGTDTNVVTVTLTEERRKRLGDTLERRSFISQSSCGICGKEVVKDLIQTVRPVTNEARFTIRSLAERLQRLSEYQTLRQRTRGSHAAILFDEQLNALAVGEDVGRHNALDKAIGKLFLEDRLQQARIAMLSSRVSYEMMQKSGRAGIPIVLAMSRPTALAAELAHQLNITLASKADPAGLYIFNDPGRLQDD